MDCYLAIICNNLLQSCSQLSAGHRSETGGQVPTSQAWLTHGLDKAHVHQLRVAASYLELWQDHSIACETNRSCIGQQALQ